MLETLRLKVEKLVTGGEGIAFVEGRAVFVRNGLPGELVDARVVEARGDWSRAEAVAIVEASPDRVAPPCPIYGDCGGCNLQHLSYEGQVREKALMVRDIFQRTGHFDPGVIPVVPSPPYGYRNRLQLHFSPTGRFGFMHKRSSTIVEASSCPIAIPAIQGWMEAAASLADRRDELGKQLGGKDRFVLFGQGERVFVEGRHRNIGVELCGESFAFDIGGFFQSNLALLEELIPEAVEGLEGQLAGDLFSGVGLFARFLAKRFARVVMVEQNREALAAARVNVPGPAHEFHAQAVEDWCRGRGRGARLDALVLDPPRAGLAPPVRAWIGRQKPARISYVSCDPVTLARDARDLLEAGYLLESLKVFDFYPQTGHVETLARFSRGGL